MHDDEVDIVKIRINGVCKRCGRKLKSPKSIELGFGVTCYKKQLRFNIQKPLFYMKKRDDDE